MKFVITLFYYLAILIFISGCGTDQKNVYVIEELDLVPEGITYSEKTNAFYLTSIGKSKIIEIDRTTGEQTNFISEKEFGYMPGAGIYLDSEKARLYALGGYYRSSDTLSALFIFNLNSKQLVNKYSAKEEGAHFLNDLIADKNGNIFITDTKGSSIYCFNESNDSLTLFYQSAEIRYPNGIAISDDNKKLYIASHIYGVRVLDIEKKMILNDPDTTGISKGIDGLELYKGNLYALQNGVKANGDNFRKLILDPSGNKITGVEIIDTDNPGLSQPLTFCILDNKAVVIANSNLQYLDQRNYTFIPADSTKKTKLLVYDLE